MQLLPFAHAHERQEVLTAPLAQLAARQRRALLRERFPQVQNGDEVGARIGERRVLLIGLRLRIGRPLARILGRQERRDDQHLGHAVVMARREQHARQARIERQRRDLAAEARHDARFVDGLQLLQQPIAVVDQPRVRRIDEREVLRLAEFQRRHLQDHAREIRAQHFRRRERRARDEVILRIQPDADARAFASRTSLALIGARLRDRLDRQALHLAAHAVAADARQPGIDDVPNARHGERRLRDVGREHDAPRAVRSRRCAPDRASTGASTAAAPRCDAVAPCPAPRPLRGSASRPAGTRARRRDPRDPARCTAATMPSVQRQLRVLVVADQRSIAHFDRIAAAGHLDDRRAAEEIGEALRIDRRGGDDDAQLRTLRQHALAARRAGSRC